MKVQISLNDALLERIDAYADENYMSRSGLLSLAATQYLNAQEVKNVLNDMATSIRKIADTCEVDSETQQKLFDLERCCRMFASA